MKKIYLLLIISSFFGLLSNAQEMKMISTVSTNLVVENKVSNYTSITKNVDGVSYEDFNSVSKIFTMEKDAPSLPTFSKSVQLPNVGKVSYSIVNDGFDEYDNINVLPSKGSLKRNVNPSAIPYVFGPAYNDNAFYPGKLAEVGNPFIFRDTRGAVVTFYPYQYNPVTKKLRVYKNLRIEVNTNTSVVGLNEKTNTTTATNTVFNSLYKNLYLNSTQYNPVQEEGDLLVITPSSYASTLQSYVNWKIEKGIKTTVVTLDQTGTTPAAIKSFIQDFYANNPGLVYVQLVGDHENLPCHSYGITGAQEQLWSDSFYGQLEGDDYFPELIVGRFSGNVVEVQTMITRTLEYETNPFTGDWMTKAIGIGSNEGDGYGDDGEPDWQHLRNIGTVLTNYGYSTIHEFYDGSHGGNDADNSPSAAMISTAINQGAGLLNYTGHGWTEGVSTGDYTNSSVNALTNTNKYPFVISVACNNGTFVGSTSLCEAFTRVKYLGTPTGAIASCGSSILMAWAEPMQTQDEMTELIVRSDSQNIKTSLGGLFYNGQISMLEAYNQSPTSQEVMQTWVFFGDPSTIFRSKVTTNIIANHVETISVSGANLEILSNTNGALVSITQDNEIIALSEIVDGVANIEIPVLTSMNNLKVTLTKDNTKPYRGEIAVEALGVSSNENLFSVYPNPASSMLTISTRGIAISEATIQMYDINGRIMIAEQNVNLSSDYSLSTDSLSTGLYFLSINTDSISKVIKVEIR
ncbi:MAG: T9SS type A sorting domain-containing protein [Flavobacteriales bacterium]|nr:T9SS type A sorting domain-containing protein [Flavobacteriales bacterium]